MSGTPAVSFLIPAYNAAATVERALGSVLAQRGATQFEVVALDDGSTDGTGEILERLAGADSRVRVARLPRIGLVPALIRGQALCRGEYIARMDADDLAHPDRLALQLALMERDSRLGLVGTQVRYFPDSSVQAGARYYEQWLNGLLEGCLPDSPPEAVDAVAERIGRELFIECPLAHPTFLMRREAFEQAGGYRDFRGCPEDYDLLLRFAAAGWRIGGVGRVLHAWCEHPERSSRMDPRYCTESFLRLKLHHLIEMRLDGGSRPVSLCGAGPVGKAWLKALQAAGVPVRFLLEVNPRKLGKKIHGVPVVRAGDLRGMGEPGLILGAVGQRGARESIRASLVPLGYVEGKDFILVA